MWGNREMVLALIVVAALHGTLNGAIQLGMALDSVDDRYEGCRNEVLKEGHDLLRKELAASPGFQKAWAVKKDCTPVVPGGLKEHGQAVLAFAYGGKAFRKEFNHAVETMGGNHSFPFQSLHFLLTDAMSLLSEGDVCRTVYRLSQQKYSAQKGAKVRLGGFMTASSDASMVLEDPDLEGGVLFNITSCFVVNLEKMTCGKEEMLLLPAEEYTVEDVHKVDDDDHFSHTSITLKHHGFSSTHNCYLEPRAQKGSSTHVVGCIWAMYLTVAVFGLLN
ncbi:unnamed protein product [Lota lota]